MRLWIAPLAALAVGAAAFLVPTADRRPPPRVVRDLTGRDVAVPAEPRRIVSLLPSCTELLFAAGAGPKVVGVSSYCDYPPAAASLPKLGGLTLDLEGLLRLRPDLVVSSRDLAAAHNENLAALGLPVLCVDPKSFAEIAAALRLLGDVVGTRSEAERAARDLERRVAAVAERVRDVTRRPRVYVEAAGDPIIAAAPGMAADEVIRLAGGENIIVEGRAGKWVPIAWEAVLARDPEVIVLVHVYGPKPSTRPGWSELSAVKAGRVHVFDRAQLLYPTPRLAVGLELMARALHPEVFNAPR